MALRPEVIACSSSAMRTFALACFILSAIFPLTGEADTHGGRFRPNDDSGICCRDDDLRPNGHRVPITTLDSYRRRSRVSDHRAMDACIRLDGGEQALTDR